MAEYMMTPEDVTALANKMATVGDELLEILSMLLDRRDQKDDTAYYNCPEIMQQMRNLSVQASVYKERMSDVWWECKRLYWDIGDVCGWWDEVKEEEDE